MEILSDGSSIFRPTELSMKHEWDIQNKFNEWLNEGGYKFLKEEVR